MGAAKTALVIAALAGALAAPCSALADPCTGVTDDGERFPICFDPGNRISVTAASDGFGGALALRHGIHFEDEPDLVWKMEHVALATTYDAFDRRFDGMLYRGRFLRHSRDGHILIPIGAPKKIFLPFDIGAVVEVGRLHWQGSGNATVGLVKTAMLVDITRSRDFRKRLAFGPVARWDVGLTRSPVAIADHRIAPFSALLVELHLESDDGLYVFDVRGEAGSAWHSTAGWQRELAAEASLERILIAIDDRPIALYASGRYDQLAHETVAGVGVRIVLFDRTDPRVQRL